MRILGLIPARGGSKGIPKKNIKILGGRPLIAYSIASAKESILLDRVIVSTDASEIFQVAETLGLKPPFIRPSDFASDTATSLQVVLHALTFFEEQHIFFDAVCLLQPTSPFRKEGFIDEAIAKFKLSGADSLVSVLPVPHEYNPHWVFEANDGLLKIATGEEAIISRRQELPKAYHRDGSVYITKVDILKSGSLYGQSTAFIENTPESHVNIDTEADWVKAETIIIKNNNDS